MAERIDIRIDVRYVDTMHIILEDLLSAAKSNKM